MGGYVILGFLIGVLFSLFGLIRYELDYVEKRIVDLETRLEHLKLDDSMKNFRI